MSSTVLDSKSLLKILAANLTVSWEMGYLPKGAHVKSGPNIGHFIRTYFSNPVLNLACTVTFLLFRSLSLDIMTLDGLAKI